MKTKFLTLFLPIIILCGAFAPRRWVAENHTYFVGDSQVGVHNADCSERILKLVDALRPQLDEIPVDDLAKWGNGTFEDTFQTLAYHYDNHGKELASRDLQNYVNSAEVFSRTCKNRSQKAFLSDGMTRYTKNGKYIILDSSDKIVSYGKESLWTGEI